MKNVGLLIIVIAVAFGYTQTPDTTCYKNNSHKFNDHKTEKGDIEPSLKSTGVGLHNVGNLELLIDDVGGNEGWRYTYIWPISMSIDHLYWNWLAIGYSDINMSDGWDGDWLTTPGGNIVITEPGFIADEEGYAQYNDSLTENNIEVTQESYAWANSPHDDYIVLRYAIKNTGSSNLPNLFAGHRSDFDVLGDHWGAPTDMSDFDNTRNLAYMWDTSSTLQVGVKLLEGTFRGYHIGWYNVDDAAKFYALSTPGADPPTSYPDDWCFWLSSGPYDIAPGDSVVVTFAFLAGDDLPDLQANADAAQVRWDSLGIAENNDGNAFSTPCRLRTHPNPFTSMTNIELQVSCRDAALCIYNANGRIVKSFHIPTSGHNCTSKLGWDGCDDSGKKLSSGVYFVTVKAGDYSATEKLLLIR